MSNATVEIGAGEENEKDTRSHLASCTYDKVKHLIMLGAMEIDHVTICLFVTLSSVKRMMFALGKIVYIWIQSIPARRVYSKTWS